MVLMLAVSLLINMVLIFLYTSLKRDLKALRSQIQYANENNSRFPFFTGSVNHDLKKIICLLNIKKEESIKIMNQICRMDQNLKDMIADIAHDIRTPLTSVCGYVQLLEECDDQADKARYFEIINQRLAYLKTLLEELFFYTKLVNGSIDFTLSKVCPAEVLRKTLMHFYNQFEAKQLALTLDIENENCMIESDELYLQRILDNLCGNVLMHGAHYLKVTQHVYDDFICIQFKNDYAGDALQADQLFQRYYTSSVHQQGSGLGLAIVMELAEGLAGSADAQIEAGELCISLYFQKRLTQYE